MKTLILFFLASTLLVVCPPNAEAREPVSIDFFYDNLEPYGAWREVGDYGYCWQPRDVDRDWRPYSDGRWLYSDAGWTWDSDEPYSWAVYHYGRWANVDDVGWVWIPGTEWGPGWVSWRHSSEYVGWAPLPPEARFDVSIGISAWADDYYDIGPRNYCFVHSRNFGNRHLRSVFVDQSENYTIINQTTNITNITYQNNGIHNGGPRFDQQSRLSDQPFQRYTLDRRQDFDGDQRRPSAEHLRSRVDGKSLSVFALPFAGHSNAGPSKHGERIDHAQVNRGWSNAGSPEDIAALRSKMQSKQRPPESLPPKPKFDRANNDQSRIQERPSQPMDQGPKGKARPPGIPADPKRLPSEPETKPKMHDQQRQPSDNPKHDKPKDMQAPNRDTPGKPNEQRRPQSNDAPKSKPQQQPEQRPQGKKPDSKPQEPKQNKPKSRPQEPKYKAPKPQQNKPEPKRDQPKSAPQAKPQAPSDKGKDKTDDKHKKKSNDDK